jgi:hypothetical protein
MKNKKAQQQESYEWLFHILAWLVLLIILLAALYLLFKNRGIF